MSAAQPASAQPTPSPRRILIVEDEIELRELLQLELSRHGYDVEVAENGLAAVAAARRQHFDLAITDLIMPEMGGVETLRALKAIDPTLIVLIATGYSTEQTEAECFGAGAAGYLRKPFDLTDLFAMVDQVFAPQG